MLFLLTLVLLFVRGEGLSTANRSNSLLYTIQQCTAPHHVLDRIGKELVVSDDPTGDVSRIALVRLSRQLIAIDNRNMNVQEVWLNEVQEKWSHEHFASLVRVLLESVAGDHVNTAIENIVDGIKAISIISRLLPTVHVADTVANFLSQHESTLVSSLNKGQQKHLLSGLDWAVAGLQLSNAEISLPECLSDLVKQANLSFGIYPGLLSQLKHLTADNLVEEVDFQVETIRTASQKVVQERRQTAWQGDHGIGPFLYSGKSMPRREWSPTVRKVRDTLILQTGQRYDCCLLNLYPDGGSAMRFHIDPDQGRLWDFDTAVVSIGATRRFAFRSIENSDEPPHNFVVMHGDVTHMFADCQEYYQHAVKKADQRAETTPRISLVYKRTWPGA